MLFFMLLFMQLREHLQSEPAGLFSQSNMFEEKTVGHSDGV